MTSNYEVGTRAWQPDPTEGWVPSELVKKDVDGDKVTLEFQLENGEVRSSIHPALEACGRRALLFPMSLTRAFRRRDLSRCRRNPSPRAPTLPFLP